MKWIKLLCDERFRQSTSYDGETRTEIERDFGRIVFSTPLRRLQDKAQVFPLEPIDAVRTRLTHSMEVSSVARGYAKGVARELLKNNKIDLSQAYEIECLAATCGLIHDMGNPPFGHAGEDAIRSWFKEKFKDKRCPDFQFWNDPKNQKYRADLENFEGNAQTLRLLTKLQILSDEFGLNLTFATLASSFKYTASSVEIDPEGNHSKEKLGYYQTEVEQIAKIREKTGIGESRHPISFLVEAADDSVYAVVDIEDGIKKGVVTWKQVKDVLSKSEISPDLFDATVEEAEKRIEKGSFSSHGKNTDEFISQYFRTLVIAKAHNAVIRTFLENYSQIMDGSYDKELLFECGEIGKLYRALKKIGAQYVWNSKETLRLELLGRNVIHSHLELFSQIEPSSRTKTFPQKSFHLLSSNYREIYEMEREKDIIPEHYLRAILITDYISGMTDSFALNLHRELSLAQ